MTFGYCFDFLSHSVIYHRAEKILEVNACALEKFLPEYLAPLKQGLECLEVAL